MKTLIIAFIFSLICAPMASAQVIDYAIDPSFNSGWLYNRGRATDIRNHESGRYMVMGMFSGWDSPFEGGGMVTNSGEIYNDASPHYTFVYPYKNGFVCSNPKVYRFEIPFNSNNGFQFEFSNWAYVSGPLYKSNQLLITPEDHILVTGIFPTDSTLTGTPQYHTGLRQLCLVDSLGAPVPDFPMLHCASPIDAQIYTIHQLSTGGYIVAGDFNEINGYHYPKIAKLNPDFSVDTAFAQVFQSGNDIAIVTLIDSQDRIWGVKEDSGVLLSNPNHESRIWRLLPDGNLDTTFQAPVLSSFVGGTYENPTTPRNSACQAFEDSDGTFILYGGFTYVNAEFRKRIVKINDSGDLITGAFENLTPDSAIWNGWTGGFSSTQSAEISRIIRDLDGKLMVVGRFSTFGGEPYSCVVRLQANGFVGMSDRQGIGQLKIWPNPAHDYIEIELPNSNKNLTKVEFFNLQGQNVLSYNQTLGQTRFPIQSLHSGIYITRVFYQETVYTARLIISK